MLFEALIDFALGLLDICLSLSFKFPLNLIQLADALIPECKVLLSHFADEHFDIVGLFLECLGVLIVLFLEFLPKLIDELILGCDDKLESLFLLSDGLNIRRDTLERDSHSSYYLSSDHLISSAVFFLLEATASCWMAMSLSCALLSSNILEFF